MTTSDARAPHWTGKVSKTAVLAVGAVVLIVACLISYFLGAGDRSNVLEGTAYVGADQASVDVDGWTYGFTPSAVMWYDEAGVMHESGTAPCLDESNMGQGALIQFGAVSATGLDGTHWRPVTWVRCLQ